MKRTVETLEGGGMWHIPVFAVWLFAISILDIKCRKVPVWLLAVGGVFALPALCLSGGSRELFQALRGMLPGILLLAAAFFTGKAGYGDGIVLLALGAVSKGRGALLLGISLIFMSMASVVLLALRKVDRDTKIPYLPFLTAAWLLVMGG